MAPSLLSFFLLLLPLGAALPGLSSSASDKSMPSFIVNADAKDIIRDSYLVVFHSNVSDKAIDAMEVKTKAMVNKNNLGKRGVDGKPLGTETKSYRMSQWRAMYLQADLSTMNEMINAPEVAYIEADHWVAINGVHNGVGKRDDYIIVQTNPPPGLARISHGSPNGTTYIFNETAGQGSTVYVVDTGIMTTHREFQRRARLGANFVNNVDTDENGHGTHVAATIGGATYGIAKNAEIVGVKVLNAQGAGPNSALLQGLQYVMQDVRTRNLSCKAVMNMSLGGSPSRALDSAMKQLDEAGVINVVAAGNERQDARNVSPARSSHAITVAALNSSTDTHATFSNFGPSVDIYAPGVKIESAGIRSNTASKVLSGTSMAAPHAAGVAATIMDSMCFSNSSQLAAFMSGFANSTESRVIDSPSNTVNLILNNGNVN